MLLTPHPFNIGPFLRGGDIVSSFAHRINAHIGTQGFVLHSAKLGLHDKGGQKGWGGGDIRYCVPHPPKGGGTLPPVPLPPIDAHVRNKSFQKPLATLK